MTDTNAKLASIAAQHYERLCKAYGEIEQLLGTVNIDETVEMVRALQTERDKAVVRAKFLEKAHVEYLTAARDLATALADNERLRKVEEVAREMVRQCDYATGPSFWEQRDLLAKMLGIGDTPNA